MSERVYTAEGFQLVHKETGLDVREYAKTHKIRDVTISAVEFDLSKHELYVILKENGFPGVCYDVDYEGPAIYWLDPAEWEVRRRLMRTTLSAWELP